MSDKPMSILDHLDALRRVLIVSIISVIPGTVVGWFIRKEILRVLIKPVSSMHYSLVYIGATEALTSELKIAFFAGLAIASPVIAYQLWKFVLPALHTHEKRYLLIFVPLSVVLFIGGIAFGYYTVFIYGVQFLLSFGGEGLTPMLSLGKYLSFAMWFLIPFGIMFEMPLVILLLVRLGIMTPKYLAAKRKWMFLAAFVIAAVATPTTDMFTQTVMAAAIYLLYEISIWISYIIRPKKRPQLVTVNGTEIVTLDISGETVENNASETGDNDASTPENMIIDKVAVTQEDDRGESEPETPEKKESPGSEDQSLEQIYRNILERGNNNDD